jgi:hypothetical protein
MNFLNRAANLDQIIFSDGFNVRASIATFPNRWFN